MGLTLWGATGSTTGKILIAHNTLVGAAHEMLHVKKYIKPYERPDEI